jgi:hypothetical protein
VLNEKGREPPESKDALRHGIFTYVPEEVLLEAKGSLAHSVEMREGDKAWQSEGFRLAHMAVGQSFINPGTGSVHCTTRRDAMDSGRSLSGLEKLPLHF